MDEEDEIAEQERLEEEKRLADEGKTTQYQELFRDNFGYGDPFDP
jgi:hypothetical protein